MKVLFVCTGNICRSSTAEAILRSQRPDWQVDSCGTHNYHVGQKSDSRARQIAKVNGLDMEDIRARQIDKDDFHAFDYIIAMDRGHHRIIESIKPKKYLAKISLFLDHGNQELKDVPDPYYGDINAFKETFEILNQGMNDLIQYIESDQKT